MSLIRSTAAVAALAALLAMPSFAATGGADLPGGAPPAAPVPEPSAPMASVVEASSPPAAAPAPITDAASPTTPTAAQAEQVALFTAPLRMPVLATAARKADDPIAIDLAALPAPSPVAAIDGHVVVIRPHMAGSELLDLADPAAPRVVLASTRGFGAPHAGLDADGRAIVVASPCAGADEVVRLGQAPRCPLRAIDLGTGVSRALPGTTGALAGDLRGTRLVFSRRSPSNGVQLYESVDGAAPQTVDLPDLAPAAASKTASARPTAGSLRAPSFDVDSAGRLAVVLEYRSAKTRFRSDLWFRDATGGWRRLTTVGTAFRGLGLRHVLGPRLDETGVSVYVEGVVESPSFVARWSDEGDLATKRSVRRSLGRSTILHDSAFDGDRLVFVDWLPGVPCGAEGAVACGLRALPGSAPSAMPAATPPTPPAPSSSPADASSTTPAASAGRARTR